MHPSSFKYMGLMAAKYLDPKQDLVIYDIGSYNVNGCYKPLFNSPKWVYKGVDLEKGPNVDIVLDDPYNLPIESESVDVVISGQAFEHIEFFWLTWNEIVRILKPGGIIILIAPSKGEEHKYPQDCWRFYPDGYRALAKYAKIDILEVFTDWNEFWGDTVGVFRK